MSDDPLVTLQALEREEARLRERLAKISLVKNLLGELGLKPETAGPSQPRVQPENNHFAHPQPEPPAPATASAPAFDGTFQDLVSTYRRDERSSYQQLKYKVRLNYDSALKRLVDDIGPERVGDWNADRIKAVYDSSWAAGGKVAMGRSMIAKLRLLSSFGSTVLDDDSCTRLSAILSNMRFPNAKSKSERLTRENALAIRITARQQFGWDSIALAQALQFEFPKLLQSDVIGEWVPLSEPGPENIVKGTEKWVRGLLWSDIGDDMVIRRKLMTGRSREPKEFSFSLKRAGMVMEEINRVPLTHRVGPMIVCEFSGLPWTANEYRRKWRKVADKAGVPKSVRNMDSHGKASEGESESGAD